MVAWWGEAVGGGWLGMQACWRWVPGVPAEEACFRARGGGLAGWLPGLGPGGERVQSAPLGQRIRSGRALSGWRSSLRMTR